MTEVKIPTQFYNELLQYLSTRPYAEVEVAIANMKYFYDASSKTVVEETTDAGK